MSQVCMNCVMIMCQTFGYYVEFKQGYLFFTCSMVFPITSGHASWVSIWNMEKNAFQNMSNFFKFSRWQNNCIDIEPITTRTHIVNNNKLPNFKPGPNILYTKSSSMGEIFARRNTRATCNIRSR